MKKIYLMMLAILFAGIGYAQVSSYSFASSGGTYTAITGGTVIGQATSADPGAAPESASMDDHTYTAVAIPFTFNFNGQAFTSININTNGWVSFGAIAASTSTPISAATAYNGVISAFSNDMMGIFAATGTRAIGSNVITAVSNTSRAIIGAPVQGTGIPAGTTITAFDATTITMSAAATTATTAGYFSWATGEIRVETIGSAPNRVFVIQFKGLAEYSTSAGTTNNTSADFQVRLSEGGGNLATQTVQIIYGDVFRAAGSETIQVGLRGVDNTDFNNRTSTTDWSATAAGGANNATVSWSASVNPASGLTFTWTPNVTGMDFVNLQSPATATIALAGNTLVSTQGFETGVTEAAGAGAGITVWVGVYGSNTDPATWPATAWTPATFNVQAGNNDEFSAAIGSTLGAGTYYYASRWQLSGGLYKFGGYNAGGGGFWNGTTNVSGILTVTPTVANDVCSGAINLTVNTDLACASTTAGTTVGATLSPELPVPTCSATGINDDVWYTFTATGVSHVVTITGATSTTAAQVYSGTCGNLAAVNCGSTTSGTLNLTVSGLTATSVYYVRVYTTTATVGTTSNFSICVGTPPPPPANDNICGAVALGVSAGSTCTTSLTAQSTQFSTQSLPGCAGTADEDIWYSFVATNTTHIITLSTSGTGATDRVHEVFTSSDNTCNGTLTSLLCSDPESSNVSGLTIGKTYFVRVYSFGSGNYTTFNICITTPATPPANDLCSGAIALPVNATCVSQSFNTLGATDNNETGDCSAGTEAAVWFKFVATQTNAIVTVDGAVGFDAVLGVLNACGATTTPTGGDCVDATGDDGIETRTLTGLTVGNTYLIQVYDYQGDVTAAAAFDICVTAVGCPVASGVSTGSVTTTGATVTWTGTGTFILEYGPTGFTPGTGATAGTGGTVINPATSPQIISGLSVATGYDVYIRQNCTGAGAGFSANSTVSAFTTAGPPPANNECSGATVLTSTPIAGTTINATQSQAAEACAGFTSSAANDVWYQFTATANGAATVTVSGVTVMDVVVQAYSGSCASLANIGCADATSGTNAEVMVLNGLVLGQTYYVRVYGYNGLRGTFNIAITGVAVPVTIEYFKGSKQTSGNLLDWKVACYNSPTATMVIERSRDARKFDPINSITETATRCLQPFSFVDAAPLSGINYYRLKTVDADGKETYSTIVALLNKTKGFEIVSLMPNPVKETAILSTTSAIKTTMQVVVSDLAGRQLTKQSVTLIAGSNQVPLKLGHLSAGTYQVTGITADGTTTTLRFVKE
jgi:hypothetical protein